MQDPEGEEDPKGNAMTTIIELVRRNPMRSLFLRLAFAALAAIVAGSPMPGSAQTQAPSSGQTIRFLITHPAGGLPDTVARIVARRLQERLGQTVVVENRPGANGGIAVSALLSSPADGHTFVVTDGAILSINPQLYNKLPYEPKDVQPVAFLARAPLFLAVHPKVPVGTLKEFIDYVKAHPGQLNYGSSGVGSIHHVSMEGFKVGLNLNMAHVPFKGTGESVPALLGGHVEVLFSAFPSLSGAAGTNRVKLLAANSVERSAQAPELPAISELIPGFDFAPIVGLYARVGTPPAIIQKIAAESIAIVKEPEAIKQLAVVGVEPVGGGPDDFARALKGEVDRVAKVVQAAGIKLQ
jgi:tripartite-type tricarboxylate transporter receptor subunit TctC